MLRGFHLQALDHFQTESRFGPEAAPDSADLRFLNDLVGRILHRGVGALPSVAIEREISNLYGSPFGLKEMPSALTGCIEWQWQDDLPYKVARSSAYLDGWTGDPSLVEFDPTHPENERRLFKQLIDHYGPRLGPCIYTQVPIADLVPTDIGTNFLGQRVDFLISFPNGRSIILEPGDHDAGPTPRAQEEKDRLRTTVLAKHNINTLRFANARIGSPELLSEIDALVENCDGKRYLTDGGNTSSDETKMAHLVLLPTLIARIEHALAFFLLQRGMFSHPALSLCIVEQDVECAELTMFSFLERLQRLSALYAIECPRPKIDLVVVRGGRYSCADLTSIRERLNGFDCKVEVKQESGGRVFDLLIDAAIKTNHLTTPSSIQSKSSVTIRNAFSHSRPHRFSYSSLPRSVHLGEKDEALVESFLGDFFRKARLKDGQYPIIRNVFAQKSTIGLLPTGAGKSICYQIASLLTPGITLVVDPIVFLMVDQVLGLSEQYGITKVAAWHKDSGLYTDGQIGELMATQLMIFMAPERFLRPSFRVAMKALLAGDLFINYAVIDEAHCVSMWGHDFRPPYLMLERCLREFCSLRGHAPVVVALTGTASQLVLIDLKRELHIEDFESIIRPKTYDRGELTYSVIPSPSRNKLETLKSIFKSIEGRLGIQNIRTQAWGVLFAHKPKQVWDLYGELASDANRHVAQISSASALEEEISCGLACGNMPKNTTIEREVWTEYKRKILPHFKGGRVRLLVGNEAIGVGIDNEFLNYVVTYCMPSSLETLGQQWGRAGRRGQKSQCYLVFSDDYPEATDRWLNGDIDNGDIDKEMSKRRDDLGTLSFFFRTSFPGKDKDRQGTRRVLVDLWKTKVDADGRRPISGGTDERIQVYLSYLTMMGIAQDFEVTGTGAATRYHVKLQPFLEESIRQKDLDGIKKHLVRALQTYLSRYRPVNETEISEGLTAREEEKISAKAIGYLIGFIYDRIAYQRKEAIRTTVAFCREPDLAPESIRRRLKAYFDRDPKFSDRLDSMADKLSGIDAVIDVVNQVDGYDDIEHLIWETRRLLSERLRADWAAISLYAGVYADRSFTNSARTLFQQMMDEVREGLPPKEQRVFLTGFFNLISTKLPTVDVLPEFFAALYDWYRMEYLSVIDLLSTDSAIKERVRAFIGVKQMGELLNGVKHKHGLG